MPEYGAWILEFGQPGELGLLNNCVPHVLMKRFAQSCWSELCEIYDIPPRVMKTNTHDRGMVTRAEKMMKDMGSAAWFIIDGSEEFEFAQGVSTNGDVSHTTYKVTQSGLRLRDYIAISAMPEVVRSLHENRPYGFDAENIADTCYRLADEMLKRRQKT